MKGRRRPNSSDRLRKVQLSFYPGPEDYEKLKALSAITGVPQQVYLRQGLQFVLKQELGGPRGGALFLKAKGTRRQVWLEFLEHLAQRDRLWAETKRLTDRSVGKVWPGDRWDRDALRTLRSRRSRRSDNG